MPTLFSFTARTPASSKRTPETHSLYKLAAVYGVNMCDLLPGGELGEVVVLPEDDGEEEGDSSLAAKNGDKKAKGKKG